MWVGRIYVIFYFGVLVGRVVEIGDRFWVVGFREVFGSRRVGVCRGSGRVKIRLSIVVI